MRRENMLANLTRAKIAVYMYMGAAYGYFIYSLITQTGLCGYLMDAQLRWIGAAYEKYTILIAILILGAPAALAFTYIRRKEALADDGTIRPARVNLLFQPVSWKSLLILSPIPILLALPIYYALVIVDRKDQRREIYKVDLNREPALPAGDVKFVQLTGVVQLDYQYRLERKSGAGSSARANMYAPLTGSDWTPERPVRFFINTTLSGYFDDQTRRYRGFSERGAVAVTFNGQLTRTGLPTFVENEYQRTGLLIASPHYVMDQMTFIDGRIPSSVEKQQYYMIPILGALLSMAILVGGGVGLAIRKLRRPDPAPDDYDYYHDRYHP